MPLFYINEGNSINNLFNFVHFHGPTRINLQQILSTIFFSINLFKILLKIHHFRLELIHLYLFSFCLSFPQNISPIHSFTSHISLKSVDLFPLKSNHTIYFFSIMMDFRQLASTIFQFLLFRM